MATLLVSVVCVVTEADAYRPFTSTDADVVGQGEVEIEYGHGLIRGDEKEFFAPELVVNFGLTNNLELVAESALALRDEAPTRGGFHPNRVEFVDTGIFLKLLLLRGSLHGVRPLAPSLVFEGGLGVPAETGKDEVGFEGVGLASGRTSRFLYHLNFGGIIEEGHPGVLWGGILELALRRDFSLRLVTEINGETIRGGKPENFALAGFIWELPNGMTLDLAVANRNLAVPAKSDFIAHAKCLSHMPSRY